MEDKEIIKALDCCMNGYCKECSFFPTREHCHSLDSLILALINRQQAEIERLQIEKDKLIKTYAECQKAFLKEYIDELKAELLKSGFYPVFLKSAIDKVGNKMVGDG